MHSLRLFLLVMVLLGFGVLPTSAQTAQPDIATWNAQTELRLLPYLTVWASEQNIDINTATDPANQARYVSVNNQTRIPLKNHDVWYRVKIQNLHPIRATIVFNQLLMKSVAIYWQADTDNPKSTWNELVTGIDVKVDERPIPYQFFALPVTFNNSTITTFYFKIKSTRTQSVSVDPLLLTEKDFAIKSRNHYLRTSAILGFSVCLFLFGLLISKTNISTYDKILFLAFLLSSSLLIITYDGLLLNLPNGGLITFYLTLFYVPINLSIILLFCISLMDMKNKTPKFYWAFMVGIVFYLVLASIRLIGISNSTISTISGFSGIINMTLLIVLMIRALWLRLEFSVIFSIGITCQLLAIVYGIILQLFSGYTSIEDRYIQYIGQPIFAALWTLVFFQKLNNRAKEEAQYVKEAELLNQQSRLRTDFLFNMSHEIRTPINGVLGMAQLLESSGLNPNQRYYVDVLKSAGNTLLRVINDILDLSKLDAGKLDIETVPVNLDQLLVDTVELFGPAIRSKRLAFSYEVTPDIPMHILGDPTRISQLITNLLGNAVKFTNEGSIRLRISHAPTSTSSQPRIRVEIIDSGIGISADTQARLFNAFEQADRSTNRRFGGTGLGLSICKKIVELMQGEIGVHSEIDKGSTFYFELPITINTSVETDFKDKIAALRDKKCLLLINDDPTLYFFLHALEYWKLSTEEILINDTQVEVTQWKNIDVLILPAQLDRQLLESWITQAKQHKTPVIIIVPRHNSDLATQNIKNLDADIVSPPAAYSRFAEALLNALNTKSDNGERAIQLSNNEIKLDHLQVLVAEDNDVNTLVMKGFFKRHQIGSQFTINGEDAFSAYKENPQNFSVILMDCEMPLMNGFEATQAIRAFELKHHLPAITIIALTAHALQETRESCIACGMNDVITKPLRFETLLASLVKIDRHIRSHKEDAN